MTGTRRNLELLAVVGLTVGGCRGDASTGDKNAGDTELVGDDTGHDTANPRQVDWNEVAIEVEGQGGTVEVIFRAAYDLSGYEGWGTNQRVKYESFYAAGYDSPIDLVRYIGQDHCSTESARLDEATMDLGRQLPFGVGDESLTARRDSTGDGFAQYYWERPLRDERRFTVGEVFSVLETAGPEVPPPVELTEPWAWEERREDVFAEQALRIGWEPSTHPDDVVHALLTLSSAEDPDSESSATTFHCQFEDDGGVVLTAADALTSPQQLLYSLILTRERFTVEHVDGLGPVAFTTASSTSFEVDPFPSSAATREGGWLELTAPAWPHRGGAPRTVE